MTDYMQLMNAEDIDIICGKIPIRAARDFFSKESKLFGRIRPGSMAKRLKQEDAARLLARHCHEKAIRAFINVIVEDMLKWVWQESDVRMEAEESSTDALLRVLPNSAFCDNPDLYFKLAGDKHDEREKEIICSVLTIIKKMGHCVQQETAEKPDEDIEMLKKQFEEQEKRHEAEVAALKAENDQLCAQRRQDAEKARSQEAAIQRQREEIARYEELKRLSDVVSMPERQIDNPGATISLCKVIVDYGSSRLWLKREADLCGKVFRAFIRDTRKEPYFENRDKLYKVDGPEELGTIGVWEWTSVPNGNDPQRDYVESAYAKGYPITEAVILEACANIDDVVRTLEEGLKKIPSERMLIGVMDHAGSFSGVLCRDKDFEQNNGKYVLKDSVFRLPCYELTSDDFIDIDQRHICRHIELGMPDSIVDIRNCLQIAKKMILDRSTWSLFKQNGFLKKQWQQCKELLSVIPTEDLYEAMSVACHCTPEQAKDYIRQFVERAESYLDHTDIETQILQQIVESSPKLIALCMQSLEERWTREHRERIDQAERQLTDMTSEAEAKRTEHESLCKRLKETQEKLAATQAKIDQADKLACDVESLVAKRIEDAQKDAAELIANLAFVPKSPAPVILPVSPENDVPEIISPGEALTGETEEYGTVKDFVEILDDNLLRAGIGDNFTQTLAQYMYAAYVHRFALLLAGPNADAIADALSISLFGKTCGVLICDEEYSPSAAQALQRCEEKMLIVKGRFGYSWVAELEAWMRKRDSYYMMVQPFAEDIVVEPRSLYNYVLPMFTELFVVNAPERFMVPGKAGKGFAHCALPKAADHYRRILDKLSMGKLVQRRLNRLLTTMRTALNASEAYDCALLLMPYAYATGKGELLIDIIREGSPDIHHVELSKSISLFLEEALR